MPAFAPPYPRLKRLAWNGLMIGCILLAVFCTLSSFLAIWQHGLLGDEQFHQDQILRFLRGNWTLNPSITTLPGYHLIIAGIAALGFSPTLPILRMISFGVALVSVVAFALCAWRLDPESTILRTLQYVFLPILFPFLFILYTDLTSMLFVLLALFAYLHKRYWLCGLLCVLSILIRQNNIVWLLCFLVMILYDQASAADPEGVLGFGRRMAALLHYRPLRRSSLRTTALHWLALFGFALFLIINRGVALGDRGAHPLSIHIGNIVFLLFIALPLLLPLHLRNLPRMRQFLHDHLDSVVVLTVLGFLLYWFTFTNSHPYNQAAYGWWLRNRLLVFALSGPVQKALFFVPTWISSLSIASMRLRRPVFLLLYPMTLLFLLPSWLIEQRYDLIPFAYFLLMRQAESRWFELLFFFYLLIFTLFLYKGIIDGQYFL